MVWHPAEGDDLPTATVNLRDETFGEPIVMSVIMKQSPPPIASSNNVVDRVLVLQSW
jgi:hypothetical protein